MIGCADGGLAIALAVARPRDVIAAFDADLDALAVARRAAARRGVCDRVTFEAAAPERLRGTGYDLVVMVRRPFREVLHTRRPTARRVGAVPVSDPGGA